MTKYGGLVISGVVVAMLGHQKMVGVPRLPELLHYRDIQESNKEPLKYSFYMEHEASRLLNANGKSNNEF